MQCDPDKLKELISEGRDKGWKILNERLKEFSEEGLYLGGNRVSMFEVIAFPFFERICVIEHYAKFPIYTEWMDEFTRIKSWYEAMLKVEGVAATLQKPDYLIDTYKAYRERGEKKYKEEQEAAQAAAAEK